MLTDIYFQGWCYSFACITKLMAHIGRIFSFFFFSPFTVGERKEVCNYIWRTGKFLLEVCVAGVFLMPYNKNMRTTGITVLCVWREILGSSCANFSWLQLLEYTCLRERVGLSLVTLLQYDLNILNVPRVQEICNLYMTRIFSLPDLLMNH